MLETGKTGWEVGVVRGAGMILNDSGPGLVMMGAKGGVMLEGTTTVGAGIVGSAKSTVLFPKKLESVSKFNNPEKLKSWV